MKLLLRDYLASLKERDELDAILPDLLSELGYTVFSRPQRGTQQRGVDIGAVGRDEDGERKVFLFSVKAGDLTRQDWDGTPQALRSSLNEIRDVYIRNRIPARYRELKVVICLAFGGVVQEQVRDQLKGYTDENTTDRVSFDEWNGDKIAGLLLTGVLREELLPKPLRSSFQKAVAMIDEPDVSYQHFVNLARALCASGSASARASLRAGRQLNLGAWVLFVWCRDVGNLEAAYRASEFALLAIWELARVIIGKSERELRAMALVVQQIIDLHLSVTGALLEEKIFPHVAIPNGLSSAVNSRESIDVNLALFEILGRIGLAGAWLMWLGNLNGGSGLDASRELVRLYVQNGISLIENNPVLLLPSNDRQSTDVGLFLMAWLHSETDGTEIATWLEEMVGRLDLTVRTRGRYPIVSSDYRDLANHGRDRSDEYFEAATVGSTLIPLIGCFLQALSRTNAVDTLAALAREKLGHCNMQLWMPDESCEETLYIGHGGGVALSDLPVDRGGEELLRVIATACKDDQGLSQLSAITANHWPIVLVACRHYRLPVPPGFWIDAIVPSDGEAANGALPAGSV